MVLLNLNWNRQKAKLISELILEMHSDWTSQNQWTRFCESHFLYIFVNLNKGRLINSLNCRWLVVILKTDQSWDLKSFTLISTYSQSPLLLTEHFVGPNLTKVKPLILWKFNENKQIEHQRRLSWGSLWVNEDVLYIRAM